MLTRRIFLVSAGGLAVIAGLRWSQQSIAMPEASFEVQKSEAEWRHILTQAQFTMVRKHGTEPPGSSPLNHEQRKGTFACAGCGLPLFSSETKFESNTGTADLLYQAKDRKLICGTRNRGTWALNV